MKSLLQKVNDIDNLIRQIHKMESKMRAGQIIDAWRECNRIIALLEQHKKDIIANEEGQYKKDTIIVNKGEQND